MSIRITSPLKKHGKMEDDPPGQTDNSRPNFPRPKYCMGIYLDAIDAVPANDATVGSLHAFMMTVMENMLDHFQTLDLARIKGALERRRVCDGVILEGFKNGCILAVTFDSVDALESFWQLQTSNRLTSCCQDILVDRALLRATSTVKLSMRAKLWEDEYQSCREELEVRTPDRLNLRNFEHDLDMVKRVKEHQKKVEDVILQAKDAESKFERRLGEFMLMVKRSLPQTTTAVKNIKEFSTDMKVARGVRKAEFESIDHYLDTLEFFKRVFADVEENIVHPLCQVRASCEKEMQQKLKKVIKDACAEMLSKLKPDADLQKIRHREWEQKVLLREQNVFYGLISLIPMCVDRLTTIDLSTDEYIMEFPEITEG